MKYYRVNVSAVYLFKIYEQKFKGCIALSLIKLILLVLIQEPIPADFRQYLCIHTDKLSTLANSYRVSYEHRTHFIVNLDKYTDLFLFILHFVRKLIMKA